MFSKLFTKSKHKQIEQKRSEISFLGQPSGDGLSVLEEEMSERLSAFPSIARGYFSKVHYAGESHNRLALILESLAPKQEIGPSVANACAGVVPMDILFIQDLTESEISRIHDECKAFYIAKST